MEHKPIWSKNNSIGVLYIKQKLNDFIKKYKLIIIKKGTIPTVR